MYYTVNYMTIFIIYCMGLIFGCFIGYIIKYTLTKKHGPNSNSVRKNVYKNYKGKCFKLEPIVYICPISTSMKQNTNKIQ